MHNLLFVQYESSVSKNLNLKPVFLYLLFSFRMKTLKIVSFLGPRETLVLPLVDLSTRKKNLDHLFKNICLMNHQKTVHPIGYLTLPPSRMIIAWQQLSPLQVCASVTFATSFLPSPANFADSAATQKQCRLASPAATIVMAACTAAGHLITRWWIYWI